MKARHVHLGRDESDGCFAWQTVRRRRWDVEAYNGIRFSIGKGGKSEDSGRIEMFHSLDSLSCCWLREHSD